MNPYHNKKLTSNSQKLRKNMTDEEKKLWYMFLKKLPYTVHRQKIIENYIVDFYIAEKQIIIEIDGSQHYELNGMIADKQRDQRLSELGFLVLRYSNYDMEKHFKDICADIENHLN